MPGSPSSHFPKSCNQTNCRGRREGREGDNNKIRLILLAARKTAATNFYLGPMSHGFLQNFPNTKNLVGSHNFVLHFLVGVILKGVWHEIFDFMFFFHESVSPRPPSIPLQPFRFFSKIRGDMSEWIFIAGVVDTGDNLVSGVNDTGD